MTLNTESSPQPGVWTSETDFGDGAQASLNLTVFLPLPSKSWDDRCVPSHLAQGFYSRMVKIINYNIIITLNINK